MRISDWSSDVCSSDLTTNRHGRFGGASFGEDVTGAGMVSAFIGGMVIGRRTGGWACWRFSCVCGGFWVCLPGTTTPPGGAACVVLWRWLREQDLNLDRKSVVEGKSVSVRVDLGGSRILKKKKIYRYVNKRRK